MGEPRTAREALIAHMLGELDELLTRAEQLPATIADAEARLGITVRVLEEAGDRYRLAVTAFTEEAKVTLTEHLRHKALEAAATTVEHQRAALQEAARAAFHSHAREHRARSETGPREPKNKLGYWAGARLLEHIVVALLASALTASLVLLVARTG